MYISKCNRRCGFLLAVMFCVLLGAAKWATAAPVSFSDPLGDARTGGSVQGKLPIDVASLDAEYTANGLWIRINFSAVAPITAPSAVRPNSLTGALDLDVDANRQTGGIGFVDAFGPTVEQPGSGLGVDLIVEFTSEGATPGFFSVLSGGVVVGQAPVTFAPTVVSFTVPQSVLVTAGLGSVVDFSVIVGDVAGPTDVAPTSYASISIPNPSTVLLGGGVFIANVARRKRSGLECCCR